VVLVGYPHPHHPDYYDAAKRMAEKNPNVSIRPGVPHKELISLYQGAKVHILPSWFETTGLVSLEAALCGCNIVTTSRGYARDYFQNMAWYCDPLSLRPFVVPLRRLTMRHFATSCEDIS
jgi:glycosyltransferase involved in cell wall biosynthesis